MRLRAVHITLRGCRSAEQVDNLAVIGPIARKRDHVERAFGLGRGLEVGERAEVSDARGGGVDIRGGCLGGRAGAKGERGKPRLIRRLESGGISIGATA